LNQIKLHLLKCGEVGVDPAVPFRNVSKNPIAFTGLFRSSKLRIWIPVFTYLIETPKGLVLVDTSWNKKVRTNPIKTLSFPLWFASKPRLPKGKSVDEQIAACGYQTSDIDYVILTHMDVDHVNGLLQVKDAKHILASGDEIKESNTLDVRYNKKQWKGINISPIEFVETGIGPKGKSFDVFNDGVIQVVLTPGHARGSVCVVVTNPKTKDFALLVGDTGYDPDSWKKILFPGPVYNKQDMKALLLWVKEMSEKENCKGVFACHDSNQTERIVTL